MLQVEGWISDQVLKFCRFAYIVLVLCRRGGGWACAAPVQGEPDGHGRLHVHRQERRTARRQQADTARHRL